MTAKTPVKDAKKAKTKDSAPKPAPVKKPAFEVINAESDTERIKEVQERLVAWGRMGSFFANGTFFPVTEQAIKNFQNEQGLEETGIIDEATYELLK